MHHNIDIIFKVVPEARLELAQTGEGPRDFKSLVSTDFTTQA
jgi:hypothetical protein